MSAYEQETKKQGGKMKNYKWLKIWILSKYISFRIIFIIISFVRYIHLNKNMVEEELNMRKRKLFFQSWANMDG